MSGIEKNLPAPSTEKSSIPSEVSISNEEKKQQEKEKEFQTNTKNTNSKDSPTNVKKPSSPCEILKNCVPQQCPNHKISQIYCVQSVQPPTQPLTQTTETTIKEQPQNNDNVKLSKGCRFISNYGVINPGRLILCDDITAELVTGSIVNILNNTYYVDNENNPCVKNFPNPAPIVQATIVLEKGTRYVPENDPVGLVSRLGERQEFSLVSGTMELQKGIILNSTNDVQFRISLSNRKTVVIG